jgi:hypothetical protein
MNDFVPAAAGSGIEAAGVPAAAREMDMDAADADFPEAVSEYVNDIYTHFKETEVRPKRVGGRRNARAHERLWVANEPPANLFGRLFVALTGVLASAHMSSCIFICFDSCRIPSMMLGPRISPDIRVTRFPAAALHHRHPPPLPPPALPHLLPSHSSSSSHLFPPRPHPFFLTLSSAGCPHCQVRLHGAPD